MRRILAAIDFSSGADDLVALAASLARAFSAELFLVHVAAPDPAFVGYDAGPEEVRQQRARELRSEHRELQERADALRGDGLRVQALLVQGSTVETLLAERQRLGADAIVLGSHGHGALYRALVGSTAEGVIREADCPVIVLPMKPDAGA